MLVRGQEGNIVIKSFFPLSALIHCTTWVMHGIHFAPERSPHISRGGEGVLNSAELKDDVMARLRATGRELGGASGKAFLSGYRRHAIFTDRAEPGPEFEAVPEMDVR